MIFFRAPLPKKYPQWALGLNVTRVDHLSRRLLLCHPILPPVARMGPSTRATFPCVYLLLPGRWVEKGYFSLCESGRLLGIPCQWLDPRRSRIARCVAEHGHCEFLTGPIHFLGGHAKDYQEATLRVCTSIVLQCRKSLLLTPRLIDLEDLGFLLFNLIVLWNLLYTEICIRLVGIFTLSANSTWAVFPILLYLTNQSPCPIDMRDAVSMRRAIRLVFAS